MVLRDFIPMKLRKNILKKILWSISIIVMMGIKMWSLWSSKCVA